MSRESDLWLFLVVVSYIQRVLCYHVVATRPQMVKSLCFSVIPGSVMLTHTVLEWIYHRVAITHLLHRMSQKRTYYIKYGLRPSNTITAEGLEDKVSPSTPTS